MDVTKLNFNQLLPEIKEAIDKADFVAIDTEFTGLNNGPEATAYDLPEMYYNRVRSGKMDYLLIQVGLCMFMYNRTKRSFSHRAYNFYVFPQYLRHRGTINFLCEASTLDFLSTNGFDFNKLIKEGITYLSYTEEQELRDELNSRFKKCDNVQTNKIAIPEDQVDVVEHVCQKIENYLKSDLTEELILDEFYNGFVRKLIYQTVYERFPNDNFNLETRMVDCKSPCLVVVKGKSKEEQRKKDFTKENDSITEAVGFSKVIRHLAEAKKLIIGHNMLLDVCHLINRFYVPLPDNYREFKHLVQAIFPKDIIQSSVLDHLLKRLQESPFKFIEPETDEFGLGYSFSEKKAHEAGFDAYITGVAFITMTTYLAHSEVSEGESVFPSATLLKSYKNRIHLMRLYENAFINLRGDDPSPSNKSHVFHITFPKNWVTADILKLFENYGNVYISYCNNTSAWVTLNNKDKYKSVVDKLVHCENANDVTLMQHQKEYTLITWKQYQDKVSMQNKSPVAGGKTLHYYQSLYHLECEEAELNTSLEEQSDKCIGKRNDGCLESNQVKRKRSDIESSKCNNGTEDIKDNDANSSSSGAILTKEARDFLLVDIIGDSSEEVRLKSQNKSLKKGQLESKNCLKNLEIMETGDSLTQMFEEPNWDKI